MKRRHEKKNSPILFFIPGGPGLSGAYLETFSDRLSGATHLEKVIFPIEKVKATNYLETLNAVSTATSALGRGNLIIIGHSFGARLAVDHVLSSGEEFRGIVLVNLATSFDSSTKFRDKVSASTKESISFKREEDFFLFWRRVLPFYFSRPPAKEFLNLLCKETFWLKNSSQANDVPEFPAIALEKLVKKSKKLFAVSSEQDIRAPDHNLNKISAIFGPENHFVIPNAGHFPMLENADALLTIVLQIIDNLDSVS